MAAKTNAKPNAKATVPAVPYEPTEAEATIFAAQLARQKARAPRPKMKTTLKKVGDITEARIEVDHPDDKVGHALLANSLASTDWHFTRLMLAHLNGLATTAEVLEGAKDRDDKVMSGNLAIVQAIAPTTEVETMLAVQMAAVHGATMQMASNIRVAANADRAEQFERSMTRLARTFTAQMEALKRYRSTGQQTVTVVHKHYHLAPGAIADGAQAVLGDVTGGTGGQVETEDQSHERMLFSERAAVLGSLQADGLPVQGTGTDGQESVSVPRRAGRGSLRAV
jgi:hypothetical protein